MRPFAVPRDEVDATKMSGPHLPTRSTLTRVSETTTKSPTLRQIPAIVHVTPLATAGSACIFNSEPPFCGTPINAR